MGGENLSQAERASLLGKVEAAAGQAAGLRRGVLDATARQATPLDFHYAERIGPTVLRALESLHQNAARDFAGALSVLTRTTVKTRVTRVTQVACAEFVRGLERPTCLSLIKTDSLGATGALEVSPTVLFPIIDRLLGGGHDPSPPPARPLTDIERRLASRVTATWIEALARAWRGVAPMTFELARIETNPQLAGVATPSELVVIVHGELTIAEASGAWKFCLPSKCLENVRDRLLGTIPGESATNRPAAAMSGSTTPACISLPGTVELVAELATLRIGASELAGLQVGDIITTEQGVQSPLVVTVDGAAQFHARPGAFKGRRALCIEERLEQRDATA